MNTTTFEKIDYRNFNDGSSVILARAGSPFDSYRLEGKDSEGHTTYTFSFKAQSVFEAKSKFQSMIETTSEEYYD